MKKFNKIMGLTLSASLVLASCGNTDTASTGGDTTNGDASSGEVETITFMNYSSSGANEETLDKMVAEFESQNPGIKVQVQTYGFADYFQQLATKVAGNQTPDVFELNIENFRTYAEKDVIQSLDETLTSTGVDISTIHPKALEAFQINGEQYGLPTKFSNVVMVYNKDLFDQAGVAYPTSDWTWAEEEEAGKAIRALGENYFGVYRPIQTWEFYKTVEQNGGSMMNEDQTEFTLNSPENVEALEMMVARVNDSNITPTVDQLSGMENGDLFKSGRLGMVVTGIWNFPDFQANTDFAWDIVVEPGIKTKATNFFSDAVVVSQKTEHSEAAAKFAAFLTASDESANLRLDANWDLPVALTDDVVSKYLSITPPDNKQAVFDSLDYLVMPPSLENFNQVADILQANFDKVLAKEITAQEALDNAQAEVVALGK